MCRVGGEPRRGLADRARELHEVLRRDRELDAVELEAALGLLQLPDVDGHAIGSYLPPRSATTRLSTVRTGSSKRVAQRPM